jgi:hypothetical protein
MARYGGTAPGARITKALRPLVARLGEAAVLAAFDRYTQETEAEYFSPERFATTYGHWAGTPRPPPPSAAARARQDSIEAGIKGSLKGK